MRHALLVVWVAAGLCAAELPKPEFANSFCLFPINESWHLRAPGDQARLEAWLAEMDRVLGPPRLYAPRGIAVISEGEEWDLFEFCRRHHVQLVLQGGAIDHHAVAWGFTDLLQDPVKGDRRFAQWFQDGEIAEPGKAQQHDFGYRACASRYAGPVYQLRREREQARARRIANSMQRYPDVVVACSGPIECEMHQGVDRWGDYSPFTIAEFRDYLTHRGLYAPAGERAGLGWPGGEVFAADPSPDTARGDHPTFNATFGTHFTTWSLRYWDPQLQPQRLPLDAPGRPAAGAPGYLAGGFDAPRVWPGKPPLAGLGAEGNERFWDAWAAVEDAAPGFRSKLVNFWVRDHTAWLATAGVPRDRVFSHQIPGESYGLGRLSQGATPVWTADTPAGSIGITTYFGAASDVAVFEKIVARNANWGIFEYHPHPINALSAPLDEYLHSLWTCVRFRAHVLTPIAWPEAGRDFVVSQGPFAAAMKQVLADLPDQPYFGRVWEDYAPPPIRATLVADGPGRTLVTWPDRIWADRPARWADWREFDHFEVRGAGGGVLATVREPQARLAGAVGRVQVVAVKVARPTQLPGVTAMAGARGRLRWHESYGWPVSGYRVERFDGAGALTASRTFATRSARLELRPLQGEAETWVRVAAVDGAGATGPWTERYRLSLPRPGRLVADLCRLQPQVTDSPDCAVREISVGGSAQQSLFEHPPLTSGGWARASYTVALPVTGPGRKLLFAAEVGLKDGAEASDGVRFALEVDGAAVAQLTVAPDRRWHPLEADLSTFAGRTVALALCVHPGASSAADWAAWAEPQVLLVGVGVSELPRVTGIVAQGKETRGRVVLRWSDRADDGTAWASVPGFAGYRVYRGADREFAVSPTNRLGEARTATFTDERFDGRETFYRVTAVTADGGEAPASEAVQYAP